MNGMTESAQVRRINAHCQGQGQPVNLDTALELLKRANRYVGTVPTVGAMDLSVEITEYVAKARQEGGK